MFEIIIVLFLSSMILLVSSRLANETLVSMRFLEEKAQTVQSATLGLERLSAELREAIEVTQTGDTLSIEKVDPLAPYAMDYDERPNLNPGDPSDSILPENYAASYRDRDSSWVGTVTYSTDGKLLRRTAENANRSLTTQVATSVNSFQATPSPSLNGVATSDDVFEISLSLLEVRRVVTFRTVVTVPGLTP